MVWSVWCAAALLRVTWLDERAAWAALRAAWDALPGDAFIKVNRAREQPVCCCDWR